MANDNTAVLQPTAARVHKIVCAITTDSSGDRTVTTPPVNGYLVRVVTDPGATAPTDNWDLVVNDEHGIDLLGGGGADRDTANTESVLPKDSAGNVGPMAVAGPMSVVVSNGGNAKDLTVTLYVHEKGA